MASEELRGADSSAASGEQPMNIRGRFFTHQVMRRAKFGTFKLTNNEEERKI